jgi:hypothetical protein
MGQDRPFFRVRVPEKSIAKVPGRMMTTGTYLEKSMFNRPTLFKPLWL